MNTREILTDSSLNRSGSSTSSYVTAENDSFGNMSPNEKATKDLRDSADEEDHNCLENNYYVNDENEISMLEANLSIMSISPRSANSRSETKNRETLNKAPSLLEIEDEDQKKLLAECYPELFDATRTTAEEKKEEMARRSVSPPGDDSFERYLAVLRTPAKKTEKKCESRLDEKFVVDDDEVEFEDDSEESDNEEDYTSSSEEERAVRTKTLESTRSKRKLDEDELFLHSLSKESTCSRHQEALVFVKNGKLRGEKLRTALTAKLVEIFIRRCFNKTLETAMRVIWNPRLRKTAGLCKNHRDGSSTIELSTKVCDTAERVRDTLVHEMCHAAVWVVERRYRECHGPVWKKWAYTCMKTFRTLPLIERCHNYEISAKFVYVCEGCKQTIKRQSKSLDTTAKVCGICGGRFALFVNDSRKETKVLASERTASGFALFVQQNYASFKKNELKHAEVMKLLSADYKKKTEQVTVSESL
ncbi:unnamed protein product [Caenorhabditis auriculariae]|uniref:SprT-like domain-containing protein n=1 Tax=Caenorhabditis auriculariae TaxID=2777116 RepID=A0A8S1GYB2_9PELO|nr:unnamed protein product [Caenorhabditis auriculariae]